MNEYPALPNISDLAAPIYIFFILLELGLIKKGKARGQYEKKDAITSIIMGTGSVLFGVLIAYLIGDALMALYFAVYEHRLINIPYTVLAFLVCLFIDDLRYYWSHRFSHTIRWCWANHIVHHSSQHYNLSTALRQPWLSVLTGLFILRLPLIYLGFHPNLVIFAYSVNLFYQFFIHTETIDKCPKWVESIMNTPSHHRVHHGSNLRYLDANFAGIFIIWDKLFGSFVAEQKDEAVNYGLVTNINTYNPIKVAFQAYYAICKDQINSKLKFSQRFKYLFAPPGWSHDSSTQTTAQRKKQFLEQEPEQINTPGYSEKFTK